MRSDVKPFAELVIDAIRADEDPRLVRSVILDLSDLEFARFQDMVRGLDRARPRPPKKRGWFVRDILAGQRLPLHAGIRGLTLVRARS